MKEFNPRFSRKEIEYQLIPGKFRNELLRSYVYLKHIQSMLHFAKKIIESQAKNGCDVSKEWMKEYENWKWKRGMIKPFPEKEEKSP